MSKLKKSIIVGVCAVVLSTLGIQASDTLRGFDTSLTGLVSESQGPCGDGAVQMLLGSHALCIDAYEAAASDSCPHENPQSQVETQDNMNESSCLAVSGEGLQPWRYVGLTQAQQLCGRAGKRLPTNEEWYKMASGLADQSSCIVEKRGAPALTGESNCVTPAGVYDVVGNVWEWIDEEIVNGTYNSRELPESGYVSLVDSDGVVVETSPSAYPEFGADYAWTKSEGVYGVIRGGFYGSDDDAGIFAQNLAVPLDFRTAGVGFRCVRDI